MVAKITPKSTQNVVKNDAISEQKELIEIDLNDPALYLNRVLTWLEFNRRVLQKAQEENTPLLERLKFLAILSSNLDEFFMKRIGGLKQQLGAGILEKSVDGRTPLEQINLSYEVVRALENEKRDTYNVLREKLSEQNIKICQYKK